MDDDEKILTEVLTKANPCPFCGERLVRHEDHHGAWVAHRQEPGQCIMSTTQLFDLRDLGQWNTRTPSTGYRSNENGSSD